MPIAHTPAYVLERMLNDPAHRQKAFEANFKRGNDYFLPGGNTPVSEQEARIFYNSILANQAPPNSNATPEQIAATKNVIVTNYQPHFVQQAEKAYAGRKLGLGALLLGTAVTMAALAGPANPSDPHTALRRQQHLESYDRYVRTYGRAPEWATDDKGEYLSRDELSDRVNAQDKSAKEKITNPISVIWPYLVGLGLGFLAYIGIRKFKQP